ncbi:hypothetical protein ACLOJK_021516 [Asimina triloba]
MYGPWVKNVLNFSQASSLKEEFQQVTIAEGRIPAGDHSRRKNLSSRLEGVRNREPKRKFSEGTERWTEIKRPRKRLREKNKGYDRETKDRERSGKTEGEGDKSSYSKAGDATGEIGREK